MTIIYIAGPMTGLPDLNFPAFHTEAIRLRALGHEVINPAEINPDHNMTWRECMRRDLAALVFCDAIQMLPGWRASRGATLEHHVAERLELQIFLPIEQTVPDGIAELITRGRLAAWLTFWHRLTKNESDELVELFGKMVPA